MDEYVPLSERIQADKDDLRACVREVASRRLLSLANLAEVCHDSIKEIELAGDYPEPGR